MSETIRNLLVQIGVDLSQYTDGIKDLKRKQQEIEASFRNASNATENWEKTSQGLAARVSTLSDKIKAQRDIVANLKQQYDAVANAAGRDNEAAKKLEKQYISNSQSVDKMEKELDQYKDQLGKVATAEGKSAAEVKALGGNIKEADTKTKSFKDNVKDFAKSSVGQFATIGGAIAAVVQTFKKLWDMTTEAAKFADELNTLSAQTGVSTDDLQKFGYAARFIDTEVETFTGSLKKLSVAMYAAQKGTKENVDIFRDLGVQYQNSDGSLRNNEETFYDLIDALGKMTDETKRDAMAMKLFGKSAQDLNPLIKAGKAELQKYGEEAKKTGAVVDRGTIAVLQRLDDKMQKTAAVSQATGKKMAANFAPVVSVLNDVWEAIVKVADVDEQYAMAIRTFQGSGEAAEKHIDIYKRLREATAVMGLSVDQMKLKVDELANFFKNEGKSTAEAYNLAIETLADGMDAQALAAQRATTAQQNYETAVTSALDNYKAKQEEYNSAVESTTKKYYDSMGGLFDEFKTNADQSGIELTQNLGLQVDAFERWEKEINALAKRGVDEGLINELKQMGPKALPQIKALNDMADENLDIYVSLWREKNELARKAAVDELDPLKWQVISKLYEVELAIEDQAKYYKEAGAQLGWGIAFGINSSAYAIKGAAVQAALQALAAAKRALGISSPSKLAKDQIGKNFDLGLAEGIEQNAIHPISKARELSESIAGSFTSYRTPDFSAPSAKTQSAVQSMKLSEEKTINLFTPIYLDGREIARASAKYTDSELQKISTAQSRGRGY